MKTRTALITASVLVLLFPALVAGTLAIEAVVGMTSHGLDQPARVALVLLITGALVAALARQVPAGYLATLQGTALWVPWTAALASSALYLASDPPGSTVRIAGDRGAFSLLVGGGLAGALWLLYGLVDRAYPTAGRQSPGWSGLLKNEIALFKIRATEASAAYPDQTDPNKAKITDLTRQVTALDTSLEQPGLGWVTRDGFSVAWTAYHTADEAMIAVATTQDVIDAGISDLLRLDGAEIKARAAMQTDLLTALIELDPKVEPYVRAIVPKDVTPATEDDCPPGASETASSFVSAIWTRVTAILKAVVRALIGLLCPPTPPKREPTSEEAKASAKAAAAKAFATTRDAERRPRIVIQAIHHALNTYRGARWAVLGRARWQLMLTTTVAGVAGFLVLALALIRGVATTQLEAGWAYFLVGAVAGLFLRLRLASEESQVSDDYGLEAARLYQTPLLSGMAAVIGVVLMASIAGSNVGDVIKPIDEPAAAVASASPGPSGSGLEASPSPAPTPAPSAASAPVASTPPQSTEAELSKAFSIGGYPIGIVLAIAFGLTPNLVLQRLGVSASDAKKQLVATRPT